MPTDSGCCQGAQDEGNLASSTTATKRRGVAGDIATRLIFLRTAVLLRWMHCQIKGLIMWWTERDLNPRPQRCQRCDHTKLIYPPKHKKGITHTKNKQKAFKHYLSPRHTQHIKEVVVNVHAATTTTSKANSTPSNKTSIKEVVATEPR